MDNLKQNLINLGLSEEEITIYLSTLEHGSATPLELARNTGIPRTTVYLLIDSLVDKKLLSLSSDMKKKQYIPTSPEGLIHLAQIKKEQMQETLHSLRTELPQLHALYRLYHTQPKIAYYQGTDEIIKLFKEAVKHEKIYLYVLSQEFASFFGTPMNTFRDEVRKGMLYTKEILSETVENLQYQKDKSSIRNQVILLPKSDVINIDSLLFGDKVIFLTYKNGQPHATVINDKDIQSFEAIKFNVIWHSLSLSESKE
ncbi:hypothetical protein IPM65_03750 [Candidatus Roizmanbacteria bacterium]|nr:MAG: hypothetical protein IPM65_03750 [Candidatus Roizmanbacteria bacterium]